MVMFTNRRPPPKSPAGVPTAGASGSHATSTSISAAVSTTTTASATASPTAPASLNLSDRIKARARPVIQTKVHTVVKTITRPIIKSQPSSTSTAKGKLPVRSATTSAAKGRNGNADAKANATVPRSKPKPKAKPRSVAATRSNSPDSSDDDNDGMRRRKKKKLAAGTSRSRSRSSSLSSAGGYESSSSLSSADEDYFAAKLGGAGTNNAKLAEGAPVCIRNVAALPPPGGQGGGNIKAVNSESVVRANLDAYIVDFFADPANPNATAKEWCGEDLPIVELEYPAVGATERFALLAPRRNDEYNPIEDLMVTIETILEHYLTPEQALSLFGYTPGSSFSSFSSFLKPLSHHHNHSSTTASSASNSRSSSPAVVNLNRIGTPKLSTPEPATSSATTTTTVVEPLLRSLEKARNRRDGPTFVSHVAHFNSTLAALKRSGAISDHVAMRMPGVAEKLWTKVFHQCYDRTVGPDMDELRRYAAFSDNVYGELLPKFLNDIFVKTGKVLGPGKTFVDLGSGVGNCVVQAALATGADSYGFENMAHASHLARVQLDEARSRFRMWGLSAGAMDAVEADFCEDALVPKVLKKADVVLVNNEVFTAALNDKLAYLFLDLPDDCFLVSLKPFLPPSFKLSSHNSNHPLAYLSQTREVYRPGSVSWKMEGGSYYIARVERGRLERWVRRHEEKEVERKRERDDKRSRRSESSQAMSRSASRQ